jgi:hypothetical protein
MMVYVAAAEAVVGVPDSVPVEGSRLRPEGRAGVTMKLVRTCDAVGTTGAICVPATNISEDEG